MPIHQCNGCPKGPCILVNLDPEFDPGEICIDSQQPGNRAVWREMVPAEDDQKPVVTTVNHCRACSYGHQDPEGGVSCQCEDDVCPITKERF